MCTYFSALNSKGLNSLSYFVVGLRFVGVDNDKDDAVECIVSTLFSCSRNFFSVTLVRTGIRLIGVFTGDVGVGDGDSDSGDGVACDSSAGDIVVLCTKTL